MESSRSPMSGTLPLSPEQLAAEGASLRALAQGLLRDPHAAEDVVQETWLTALVRAPDAPRRIGAWLSAVARSFALKRLRGDRRRQRHEILGSRPEAIEEERGSEERARALRSVADALFELDEPYRTALMLRYFEGLTPRALARRLGVPEPTVKSRLARGLVRLRLSLETTSARSGDTGWRDALALLAGLPLPAPVAPAGAGAPTGGASAAPGASHLAPAGGLGLALKIVGAAGGAALVVLALRSTLEANRPGLAPAGPGRAAILAASLGGESPVQDGAKAPGESHVAPAPGERREVASGATSSPALLLLPAEPSFPYAISGVLLDADDVPLAGAVVYLGPRLHGLNRAAETDASGRFSVSFRGRRPSMDVAFTAEHGGRWLGLRELHLSSGKEVRVRAGFPDPSAPVAAFDMASEVEEGSAPGAGGATLSRAVLFGGFSSGVPEPLGRAPALGRDGESSYFVTGTPAGCPGRDLTEVEGMLLDRLRVRAVAAGIEPGAYLEFAGDLGGGGAVLVGADLEGDWAYTIGIGTGTSEVHLETTSQDPPPAVELEGFVLEAFGRPVSGALVGHGAPGAAFSLATRTNEDGSFRLAPLAAGELFVRAGGGDHGIAAARLVLEPGERATWTARLECGEEIRGRLVDPRGKPVAGRLLEVVGRAPLECWSDFTRTDEEGRFAVPNCPRLPCQVRIFPEGVFDDFPATVVEGVWPGPELGDLVLGEEPRAGALELAVLDAAGVPVSDVEARVWRQGSGHARFAARVDGDADVRWRLAGLPSGAYEVEVGTPLGWRDLGRVFVTSGETLEIGQVIYDRPGAVELAVETGEGGPSGQLAPVIWREHGDVFSHCGAVSDPWTTVLAPGDYRVIAASGKASASLPLRIRPSTTEILAVDVDATGALEVRTEGSRARPEPYDDPALLQSCSACHAPVVQAGAGGF